MRALAQRLRGSAETPNKSLAGDARGTLLHSYALAEQTLGEPTGETECLLRAIAAHEAVLQEWTRDRVPLEWTGTQNNLGIALQTLGERESGTTRLEQAVAAFGAALEELTRDRVPLDWAITQNNLGGALLLLGEPIGNGAMIRSGRAAVAAAWEVQEAAGQAHFAEYYAHRLAAFDATLARIDGGPGEGATAG
jgi:Tetratricopeptide repeat